MKLTALGTTAALVAVILAGCTAEGSGGSVGAEAGRTTSSAADPTPTATPTPTPTPTPTAMTVEAAAEYYLDTVCPANAAIETWNGLADDADFATLKAGTAPLIGAYSAAAARFDDPAVLWPETIEATDVAALSNDYYGYISVLQGIANAPTEAEASFAFANGDASAAASQKIRARLGLSSDTTASCVGR